MAKPLIFFAQFLIAAASLCAYHRGELQRPAGVVQSDQRVMANRTQNKGDWTRFELPFGKSGDVIAFGSGGSVVIAGQGALLLSLDGGQTWRALSGGKGSNRYTNDGGRTWQETRAENNSNSSRISSSSLCSVESAVFLPSGRLYLSTMCDHSTALWSIPSEEVSGAWHVRGFAPSIEQYERNANGNYYSPGRNLVTAGERVLVDAILPDGSCLLTTNDQGGTWHEFWCDPVAVPIVSLDFVDDKQGWMLQANGKLLQTGDGGRTWLPTATIPGEAAGHVFSLEFINSTIGFVVGEKGLILSTKDGGRSWQQQVSETKNSLYRVAAASEKKAWAVGEKGTVLETSDGGTNWREVVLNLNEDIDTMSVSQGTAWFVVGNHYYRLP
jgi:photosystem II stability/assembly factor-like uncharacterized protein